MKRISLIYLKVLSRMSLNWKNFLRHNVLLIHHCISQSSQRDHYKGMLAYPAKDSSALFRKTFLALDDV